MNGWNQHEKKWGRFYTPIPAQRQGHGSFTPKENEPGKEFQVDEKTGLFIPGTAAKDRRKVQIGFHTKEEA